MPAPTILPQPSSTADWTVGNSSFGTVTLEPTSGKKTTGWTPAERPSPQFMNWLFYNADQWIKYLNSANANHEYRISSNEASLAALGSASNVTASNSGHTTLTGVNVQAQLDQADAALKDVYDAVTSGKGIDLVGYEAAADANWSPVPENAGAALDQLGSRVKNVEAAVAGNSFVAASLSDYVISSDKPITGFPSGIGNPGFTDNNSTNPRGIKFSELQTKWGEERIYIHTIKPTGKTDSAGREEFEVYSDKRDIRIMLYGDWRNDQNGGSYDNQSLSEGQYAYSGRLDSYILVTAICDSLALMCPVFTNNSDSVAVEIDGVSSGNISIRGSVVISSGSYSNVNQIIGDPGLTNLGYGLHTFKFTNGASDAFSFFRLQGFVAITTGEKELGGACYLNKQLATFAPQTITPGSVGGKGGKLIRYVDNADSLRKDAAQSVLEVNTAVSGSVGTGTSSLGVNSAAGFVAPGIVEISDGPTNSEFILYTAVNTFTNTLTLAGSGTTKSYTNPTVKMYAKALSAVTHANEKFKYDRHIQAWGTWQRNYQASDEIAYIGSGSTPNILQSISQDGVWGIDCTGASVNIPSGGRYTHGLIFSGANQYANFCFKGTGADILIDFERPSAATPVSIEFTVDGVVFPTQIYTSGITNHPTWYKLVSDLPEGSHILKVKHLSSSAGFINFVSLRIYEAQDPSAIATVERGDFLSKRTKLSSYLYNSNTEFPSKGVIRQHPWQNTYFGNTDGSATTFGWSTSTDIAVGGNQPFANESGTNVTNDLVRKWFYGTGIEVITYLANNRGITEFKIDGQLATAANFPSMLFQSTLGGYSTSTGLYDSYVSSAAYDKLSFSNLAEGWHELQIRNTGTKNVSSSNTYFYFMGFWVIGMAYSDDVFNTGTQCTKSVHRNGARDLRVRDAYNSENIDTPVELDMQCATTVYGALNGWYLGLQCGTAFIETHGGDIEIDVDVNVGYSPQYYHALIFVDGTYYALKRHYNAGGGVVNIICQAKVSLPAGRHYVHGVVNGTTTISVESAVMRIREVPARRAK